LTDLAAIIRAVSGLVDESGLGCALVGGLAVSARTEPRFTRDVDVAIAVADDAESERLVRTFVDAGGVVLATIEQDAVGRLAAVRVGLLDGVADLLLASSGIESEVVAEAERLEVLPGLIVPVASVGHLVALKLLARDDLQRPQDAGDLRALLAVLTPDEQARAAEAVGLIEDRGYERGRDLRARLAALLEQRG
jgi:predicted nucleotidyltransferase